MENKILSKSEHMSGEYCCSIVRIGELVPVENSDFLAKTTVDGFDIVVRRDEVKTGDIMFYASNETEICEKFLSVNNLFDLSNYEKNINHEEVRKLIEEQDNHDSGEEIAEINTKLNSMHGFFSKYGRVKMIKLRGCPSFGFLFTLDSMVKYCPKLKGLDLEGILKSGDTDFDTVDGELFIKAYIPRTKIKGTNVPSDKAKKRNKKLKRFNRIIENQFSFHYDTQMLNKNMFRFKPDTEVYISTKIHGTSFIMGNLKVKEYKKFNTHIGLLDKLLYYFNSRVLSMRMRKFDIVYDNLYASRTVLKNQYINENVSSGFYGFDIWGEYQKILKGHIPEGMTVYGEIVGYLPTGSMIQKDYDYKCDFGKSKLMLYRITTENEDGSKKEWEISDVIKFSQSLAKRDELKDYIYPMELLYHGNIGSLYKDIDYNEDWGDKVLSSMKLEKTFGMEGNEYLCNNKVPREGIVIRIANDPMKEAFKLKCSKFLEREGKLIEKGEVDMEMQNNYLTDEEEVK